MHKKEIPVGKNLFIFSIGLLLLLGCTSHTRIPALFTSTPVASSDSENLANRVIELLAKQEHQAVAHLMHYPPTYTENHRKEDAEGIGSDISFLLGRFGSPTEVKRENGLMAFFTITVGGGDVPYWQSISPFETYDFIYSVHFSNLGVGEILVRIFRNPKDNKPEIQSLGFGLPVTRPDAKSEVASAIKGMMQRNGIALPPNIDQILENELKPEGHKI